MATEDTMGALHTTTEQDVWSGGTSPYAVVPKKLGMWLFIVSDAITFSALIIAYSYIRVASPAWPRPFPGASILNATLMTVILLSSSITVVMAVRAAKMDQRGATAKWLM